MTAMFRKAGALLACCAAVLLASCGSGSDADPAKASSYRATMSVEPAAGGGLQHLVLPAKALISLQRDDLADVRVFDGKGRALPLVPLDAGASADVTRSSTPVAVFPIVGPAGSLQLSGVTLRIDAGNEARIIGIDGRIGRDEGDASAIVGTLLDTRAVREPVVAVDLDVAIPAGQPITFALERSADLKTWQPLAERVFFRSEGSTEVLGGPAIALPPVTLQGQYIRVTWTAASPLVAPVGIRAARVSASRRARPQRVAVPTTAPERVDAHDLRFATAFAAPVVAVRLGDVDGASVIPVKAYGRNGREEPWSLLGAGVVRHGEALVELRGSRFGSYRIDADERTGGFERAPKLHLLFEPVGLAVQFDGVPPYTLAAGLASAPNTYLTMREVLPDGQQLDLAKLPEARIEGDDGKVPVIALAGDGNDRLAPRTLILWLVLVLAVVVLGLAVFRLSRPDRGADDA